MVQGSSHQSPPVRLGRETALPDKRQTASVVVVRVVEARPAVEVEVVVVRVQVERVLEGLPLVSGEVDRRGIEIPANDVRPHDGSTDGVEAVHDEPLQQCSHLLALGVDRESLSRGRELQHGDRPILCPMDQEIKTALGENRHLASQFVLAVVVEGVEGTVGKLRLVGTPERNEEYLVKSLPVIGHDHLRNEVRQMHALQGVGDLGVTLDLRLEAADRILEPSYLGQLHFAFKGIGHALEASGVVDSLPLHQMKLVVVRDAHSGLYTARQNATTRQVEDRRL